MERTSIIKLERPALRLSLIATRREHQRSLLNLVVDSNVDVGAHIEIGISLHIDIE